MATGPAIEATGLVKRYDETIALAGVDLDVPRGAVLALLGPNGAGKTTTVRILTTLTTPSEGSARVAGFDVVQEPVEVRRRIGLAAQDATVDGLLTGRENLVMIGELHHLPRKTARSRADELLARFDLTETGGRLTRDYSGGMRRRLDLAATLVGEPEILFLDEPTTGLDPRGRNDLWGVLDHLVEGGVTVLLTTQYLEEAERLADDIAVVDHGRVIARGDARSLKREVGGDQLHVIAVDEADLDSIAQLVGRCADAEPSVDRQSRS
jgi:ABC-2 type transport system ATP-binding protein